MSTSTASPVSSIFYQASDNEFQLSDHQNKTHVTLDLEKSGPLVQGSTDKGPAIQYQGTEGTFSFSGPQVVAEATALGRMFTVILNIVPDLGSLSFTLFLPTVVHGANEPAQAFDTIAIKSERHLSLQGIPMPGADTSYSVLKMRGTARKIEVAA